MIRGILIATLLFLVTGCGAESRPSVLLITVDTLRYDALGCNDGIDADTPRMDGFAAEGRRFTRAQSNCPLTLPSHATILTGLLPPQHGIRDNDPPSPLPPAEHRSFRMLAEELQAAGYRTGAFVSASVVAARTGLAAGFDTYDGPDEGVPGSLQYAERRGAETAERAADWIRNADGPIFVWVHLFDPHDPYEPPAAFRTGAPAGSRAAYLSEVAYADRAVGMVLDALDETGRAAGTLAVITSDHGEGLGEHDEPTHGYLLFQTTLSVPLLLRWPEKLGAGEVNESVVSLADLAPTIAAATGIRSSERSLTGTPPPRPVVSETLYGYRQMGWAQLFAAREGERKLIRGMDGPAARTYELAPDPDEGDPIPSEPADLESAIARYRVLESLFSDSGDVSAEVRGLPYASGPGRERLKPLPFGENAKLPCPDPAFAAEVDLLKSRIGVAATAVVDAGFAELQERQPKNPSLPFWRGRNFMAANNPAAAANYFRRAFELGLADARVLALWIRCLLLSGQIEKAVETVETKTVEVVPDTGVWLMVASVHLAAKDPEKARIYADRAEQCARSNRERELVSRFRHNLSTGNDK